MGLRIFAIIIHKFFFTYISAVKFFSFILSFFFMVLTMVPCTDGAKRLGDKACFTTNVHVERSHDHSSDLCSPFCVCHCAGMSMTVAQIRQLLPEKIALFIKATLPEKNYSYAILHVVNIWQPPQLG